MTTYSGPNHTGIDIHLTNETEVSADVGMALGPDRPYLILRIQNEGVILTIFGDRPETDQPFLDRLIATLTEVKALLPAAVA